VGVEALSSAALLARAASGGADGLNDAAVGEFAYVVRAPRC